MLPCVTLWIGGRLGTTERACLRSVMRQGHRVVLYCYSEPEDVPEGVEIADAADILPESRIIRYRAGGVALFSNHFRYELQRQVNCIWLDTDVYLLKPLPDEPYLFGYQSADTINQAVFRCPAQSPLLDDLIAPFDRPFIPPWLTLRQRVAAQFRQLRAGRIDIRDMPWGTFGPQAVTALAKRHGLIHQAKPVTRFYPWPYQAAEWIRDPDQQLADHIYPDTVCVHLWNEIIRPWKHDPAPAGSFLAQLQHEGG